MLEVVRDGEGSDAVLRLVALPDGSGRIEGWDAAAAAWRPIPGAPLGRIMSGFPLSVRGISRD